jgi:hypothetical protein
MTNQKLDQLLERREEICNEMTGIKTMMRGSFNEFYYNQKLKDGTLAQRGPFYNVTIAGEGNKTKTRTVPKSDVDSVRREVDNFRYFRSLTEEYIDVCENIFLLTRNDDEAKKN